MTIEVMIDLETLSTDSNAAIISIGAAKFDPRGAIGELGDPSNPEYQHFYRNIDMHSVVEAGFHVSGQTLKWWMGSGEGRSPTTEARAALFEDPIDIGSALSQFFIWFGEESLPTWGNGAGFDNVVLRNAYQKLGGIPPFRYKHDRCYRTINALFPDVAYVPPALAHDALSDAVAQAVHLQKLFNRINQKG
jgi:hypothetical protein